MLQHWVSKGEFYTRGFILRKFIEQVICTLCILYLHCIRRNITLGRYFDTCRNIYIEHFWHNVWPEIYLHIRIYLNILGNIWDIEQPRGSLHLQLLFFVEGGHKHIHTHAYAHTHIHTHVSVVLFFVCGCLDFDMWL